jgi:hypothetical protein
MFQLFATSVLSAQCELTLNQTLGKWVGVQRTKQSKGRLSQERIQRLDDLGFVWNPYTAAWEEMFAALKDYQSQHGHCNVPARWTQNPSLGMWAHTQRKTKNKGALSEQRTRRLEALGFEWTKR